MSTRSLLLVPADHKSVDPSTVDVDLTVLWTDQNYACELRNGSASPASMRVITKDGSDVTFANIQSGASIYGLFATLKHDAVNTTATAIVAGK